MSLDVYLTLPEMRRANPHAAIFIRRDGTMLEVTRAEWDRMMPGREPVTALVEAEDSETTEIYTANITHNLTGMAEAAGIYHHLWRPAAVGITKADQLIEPLAAGLERLHADKATFRAMNPANGWGTYEGLVVFVDRYLAACRRYPQAAVSVWI